MPAAENWLETEADALERVIADALEKCPLTFGTAQELINRFTDEINTPSPAKQYARTKLLGTRVVDGQVYPNAPVRPETFAEAIVIALKAIPFSD